MEKHDGQFPYIKLFPEEYLGGSLHFGCNLEERGFFIELLCLAGRNRKERGTLSLEKGVPMTASMIANAMYISEDDCVRLLATMEDEDRIFYRDDGVIVVSNFTFYQNKYRRSKTLLADQKSHQIKKTEQEKTRKLTNTYPDEARDALSYGYGDSIISKHGEILRKNGEVKQ